MEVARAHVEGSKEAALKMSGLTSALSKSTPLSESVYL